MSSGLIFRAGLLLILLLVGRVWAQNPPTTGGNVPGTGGTGAPLAPPPPPPTPPPNYIPPPDYVDDDDDFDDSDVLPQEAPGAPGYQGGQPMANSMLPPAPPAVPSQSPSLPGRPLRSEVGSTTRTTGSGPIKFRIVEGDFWEKGKKRERGNLDQ